jgi:hypothetical protein
MGLKRMNELTRLARLDAELCDKARADLRDLEEMLRGMRVTIATCVPVFPEDTDEVDPAIASLFLHWNCDEESNGFRLSLGVECCPFEVDLRDSALDTVALLAARDHMQELVDQLIVDSDVLAQRVAAYQKAKKP